MVGKVRAHDDPHGQVLSLQKNGLSGDGALDFPHAAERIWRLRLVGRRRKLGASFVLLQMLAVVMMGWVWFKRGRQDSGTGVLLQSCHQL